MSSTRQASRARVRSVVALCRARLSATRGGRIGRTFAALVTGGLAAVAITLRVTDGPDASLSGLTASAAPWITLVTGGALALAAADDRAGADRQEGIEALVAARGFSPSSLEAARVLAAMSAVAVAIGVPLGLLSLLGALLAGRAQAVMHGAGVALAAAGFAVVAGVTLGGTGAVCGRLGRGRGRWLLFAVVAGPWMLADLAGHGAWSIPGALGVLLDFALTGNAS
jgi:ABC-type transport system involved in multi-copper enzyme maturation permease subunit